MVFARNPEPGEAKTRLIPALGREGAAAVYKNLIIQTLINVNYSKILKVDLYCTPSRDSDFFQSCATTWNVCLKEQAGHDLGMRMFNAFEVALQSDDYGILIGTDCPTLEERDLCKAIDDLSSGADAVLGPAFDGGYYLIGLRRNDLSVFTGIPWGTQRVFPLTYKKMISLGWNVRTLPVHRDIDRYEDLAYMKGLQPT